MGDSPYPETGPVRRPASPDLEVTDPALVGRAEAALTGFRDTGPTHRNCAQTVLWYMYRLLDEEPSSLGIAQFLGGGVGRSGRLCGVATGIALAVGLLAEKKPGLLGLLDPGAELRDILAGFEARFGSVECRALTACDIADPVEIQRFRDEGLSAERCEPLLRYAFQRLEQLTNA